MALIHRGDPVAAQAELDTALKLHPTDEEASELKPRLAASIHLTGTPLTDAIDADGFEPLERIRRSYSEASFRQAAFQMDEVRAMRMAKLPPAEQATQYAKIGNDYLAEGLVPEAEREFQAALAADTRSSAAHAGLAQVRERSGSDDDARAEAQSSIRLAPNAAAYLVLARLDLRANNLPTSATDVGNALMLDPKNGSALGMKQQLQSRGQSVQ